MYYKTEVEAGTPTCQYGSNLEDGKRSDYCTPRSLADGLARVVALTLLLV